jgi:hypothetical protein
MKLVEVGPEECQQLIDALRHAAADSELNADAAARLHNLEGHGRWSRRSSVFKTLAGRWLGVRNEILEAETRTAEEPIARLN